MNPDSPKQSPACAWGAKTSIPEVKFFFFQRSEVSTWLGAALLMHGTFRSLAAVIKTAELKELEDLKACQCQQVI